MSTRFLLRIDDICPTLNWTVWQKIETLLIEEDVKPILAVIPDNQDPELHQGEFDEHFWDRVRAWQARGWTIGLHGYQHRYVTRNPGILGLNKYSEFAGLPLNEQRAKLEKAVDIFSREGVLPEVWVAPAHSFDANTIQALASLGIHTISDGFSLYPHRDSQGMLWIPQQLWRLRPVPPGIWTLCVHLQDEDPDLVNLRRIIQEIRGSVTSFPEIVGAYAQRKESTLDTVFAALLGFAIRSKATVKAKLARGNTLTPTQWDSEGKYKLSRSLDRSNLTGLLSLQDLKKQ